MAENTLEVKSGLTAWPGCAVWEGDGEYERIGFRVTGCAGENEILFREEEDFLRTQLITYLGNKRALLDFIETAIVDVKTRLGKDHIDFLDLFSGTGVVARMARRHARCIHCNDLEEYSFVTNTCYQTNRGALDIHELDHEIRRIRQDVETNFEPGFIAELYAPQDDRTIKYGERVFYTRRNAIFLDSFCRALAQTPDHLKPYVLAPVIAQASVHTNTSGVFKGFYKNRAGFGQFGGDSRNALSRIMRNIEVVAPVLSHFSCESFIHKGDANDVVRDIGKVDIAYFDPPYNQHPYGSNYFMLNILCDYRRPLDISRVSGIPKEWNRSFYNKARHAETRLFDAIDNVKADFVLISYNSEGFIKRDRFISELWSLGEVSVMDTCYNTFRGCRNLSDRDRYVTENLYLVDKR